jgi:hypothetical protein
VFLLENTSYPASLDGTTVGIYYFMQKDLMETISTEKIKLFLIRLFKDFNNKMKSVQLKEHDKKDFENIILTLDQQRRRHNINDAAIHDK